MKVLIQRINTSPSYARALEWGKLVTITGSAQVAVQGLSMLGGILVIRLLSTQEYALYTLANTMLGTMAVLADGGITTSVLAQGGKVWQDREKLGSILTTAFELRKLFAVGSLVLATPFLFAQLLHHGASWLMALFLVLALIPGFISTLSGSLLEIAPKLHQDIAPLQKNQVAANLIRLALLVPTLFLLPWAAMAVLASGLPQVWANTKLRGISAGYADWRQLPDPAVRKEILKFVKRVLPGAIYYCLSGQITIWLISFFGTTTAVAQIGALGRLAMVLNVFSIVFGTLAIPRFARLPADAHILRLRYLQMLAILGVLSVLVVGGVWLFSTQVLWVLGRDYANLQVEVVLAIINACLGMIVAVSYGICTSRGWVVHPAISISTAIGAIICGIVFFNIGSLRGILLMNIFVVSVEVLMYVIHTSLHILRTKQATA